MTEPEQAHTPSERRSRIKLSDGSSWPRPALESDAECGIGWALTYSTPSRQQLLEAAAIVRAYEHLVAESTREKRDLVCREIRAALLTPPGKLGEEITT